MERIKEEQEKIGGPTDQEIAQQCYTEVIAVLKKYGCGMKVNHETKEVLGQEVLVSTIMIYKFQK